MWQVPGLDFRHIGVGDEEDWETQAGAKAPARLSTWRTLGRRRSHGATSLASALPRRAGRSMRRSRWRFITCWGGKASNSTTSCFGEERRGGRSSDLLRLRRPVRGHSAPRRVQRRRRRHCQEEGRRRRTGVRQAPRECLLGRYRPRLRRNQHPRSALRQLIGGPAPSGVPASTLFRSAPHSPTLLLPPL